MGAPAPGARRLVQLGLGTRRGTRRMCTARFDSIGWAATVACSAPRPWAGAFLALSIHPQAAAWGGMDGRRIARRRWQEHVSVTARPRSRDERQVNLSNEKAKDKNCDDS